MTNPATATEIARAFLQLETVLGRPNDEAKRGLMVGALRHRGYTIAQIKQATMDLMCDPKLLDAVRFGDSVQSGDFVRTIERQENIKLYSYQEAMQLWQQRCPNGDPAFDKWFAPVRIEGQDKPMWRIK